MTTTAPSSSTAPTRAAGIDPRGPQLTAGLTAVVLVVILLVPSPWAAVLTGVQALLFAIGATRGVQHTPHAWLFRTVVRPRLAAPDELEDPAPPRFAQLVGLVFAVLGLVGYLSGAEMLGVVATGFALVAAFVNAAVGLCLGCEAYLLIQRIRTPNTATTT